MTEWHPESDDDTERAPDPAPSRHRYEDAPAFAHPAPPPYQEPDTAQFGTFGFGGEHRDPSGTHRRPGRPGNGLVAGLLAAALVVGGVAGVVGAVGFSAVDHLVGNDPAAATTASGTTSSAIVNRKDVSPAADSVEQVANSVLPSVVKINVANSQEEGSGSGIVISSDGEILTNNHVASVAGQGGRITVDFNDGTAKKATIVGTDPVTDLAVIKAQGVSGLQPARMGTSDDIRVGENVVAIGSPFGLEATVTSGIVSALNRPVSVGSQDAPSGQASQDTTYPAIQTDAAINPGNSGGPLVDLNGDVIGINSSIRTASDGSLGSSSGGSIGLGFAIPIEKVWPVVQQLRKGQTPTHAKMGVSVADASSNGGLLTGAGVQSVNPGSAAQQAGLKKGDVVTKVDQQIITGSEALVATIRGHRPGQTVTLTVVSGGDHTRTVKVTLDSDHGTPNS
ncbi:MAG: putative serine protease PepD [Nocardioidaceae bacterium]|jgi:putative serine protease PepD|nr:putative serine protease PepD [Nocardioidaceae bacterium]